MFRTFTEHTPKLTSYTWVKWGESYQEVTVYF